MTAGTSSAPPAAGEHAVGKRHLARELALQMLFQVDQGALTVAEVLAAFDPFEAWRSAGDGESRPPAVRPELLRAAGEYARRLVAGAHDHRAEIDAHLRAQATNWRLERMPPVDRNVLRLALYELLYEPDVPKVVILDEAIELAKTFGSEQSGRFVNGLLDAFVKSHPLPGRMT